MNITDIRRYSGYTYDGVNIFNLKTTAEPYVVYDGKAHKVKPSVTLLRNGKKTAFKEGRDYTLVYDEEKYDYMSPGSHTFSVVGKGNFEGKFNLSFNIQKKKLTEDVDYYTYYSGNVNAGTATVTIRGMGDYFGSKTATFRIKGKPLSKCVFEGLDEEVYYNENGATPVYSNIKVYTDKTKTEEVEDYYIQFTDNKKPGKGTIIFIGKNGYEGTVKKTFKILGVPMKKAGVVGKTDSFEYTGEAIYQDKIKLLYDRSEIRPNIYSNYHVSYDYYNVQNVGTAKLVYHGHQYFYGDKTITYKITPFKVDKDNRAARVSEGTVPSDARIIVRLDESYTLTNGSAGPAPKVYFITSTGRRVLLKNTTDYTLSYSNATKTGTGTVKITFKGNFSGKLSYNYGIE
ncbi:hypothetical protein [Butyrivibrio sp. MC2021]|uniref:hypothetical protein n=1 Tax=Butyrivibrio sp. MC2021 TaxID=1408306 RepID=UPI0012DFDADA|nr:hypothetical protein [Butyrivibrio sp. MC2021]